MSMFPVRPLGTHLTTAWGETAPMKQPALYSISRRCTLNADTFSKLLVVYDMNASNLKVAIKAIKEAFIF